MPLAQIVDSLDSVPETARGAYVEKDGKFHLDFEIEDNAGLKSALQKERADRKALEKDVASWKRIGKTADEIAELVEAREKEAHEAAKKKGDIDAILKQHQDRSAKEKAELEAERDAARASERSAIVGERLVAALARANATDAGTELLPDRLASRIKVETVDGKRVTKIMQADGETPMAGSGADGTATIDDLVKEAVKKYPDLFKGTGAGGGGKQPSNPAGGSGVTKKSDFKSERDRAKWVEANGFEAYAALPDR